MISFAGDQHEHRVCVYCSSEQTVVRRDLPRPDFVVHVRFCKRCRRETTLWSGSVVEERARRNARRGIRVRLESLAKRISG